MPQAFGITTCDQVSRAVVDDLKWCAVKMRIREKTKINVIEDYQIHKVTIQSSR